MAKWMTWKQIRANPQTFNEVGQALRQINANMEMITDQVAHIADAESTTHTCANFGEVNIALDALGAKINAILVVLETHGLTPTS